ncbi:MAG: ORF6C domain-containing protein [Anaerolineales bacterium]|nr:ORF6C domain-containing protein [Anaerolineales bacterium]
MTESGQKPISLLRQAEVAFYGDELTGALASDGDIYIPLGQLCASLDLQLSAQLRRIRRTEALSDGLHLLTLESQDGSRRPLVCLRVDLIPGWLGGVMTSRIRNEAVRAKLIAYQRDLYKVAWAVFGPMQASIMPAPHVEAMAQRMIEITHRIEAIDETLLTLTAMLRELAATAEQMKAVSVVVEGLKSEMNSLRAELADLEARSRTAFKVAGDRIKRLELRLHPGMAISEEQAARIKEAVAYVANALQERGKSRAYAEVWAAFKQAFGLTEYKNLPQGKFTEALEWLNRWGAAVLGSPKPVPPP